MDGFAQRFGCDTGVASGAIYAGPGGLRCHLPAHPPPSLHHIRIGYPPYRCVCDDGDGRWWQDGVAIGFAVNPQAVVVASKGTWLPCLHVEVIEIEGKGARGVNIEGAIFVVFVRKTDCLDAVVRRLLQGIAVGNVKGSSRSRR